MGLQSEARIARRLGFPVAVGGGTAAGAERQAQSVIEAGARGLISFGIAGGLDPALRPGQVIVPDSVCADGVVYLADPGLAAMFGGFTGHRALGTRDPILSPADKARAAERNGAHAIDLESGAVARTAAARGLPFAVVRAICDPAERTLPPLALNAIDGNGNVRAAATLWYLLLHPREIPAMIGLARESAAAHRALKRVCADFARRRSA